MESSIKALSRRRRPSSNTMILQVLLLTALIHRVQSNENPDTSIQRRLTSIASSIRSSSRRPTERHLSIKHSRHKQNEHRHLIVGGSTAPPGRFPYAVSLQSERVLQTADASGNDNGEQIVDTPVCGGTLIASDVALTAAHCGYSERGASTPSSSSSVNFGDLPRQIFDGADVGAYDLASNYGGEGYTVDNMLFEKLIIHPDYTGFGASSPATGVNNGGAALRHDVMLVKLYGASDQPTVRIHNPNSGQSVDTQPVEGETMVVLGWGDTDPDPGEENSIMSTVLRAANVQYVPNDVCENAKGYSNIDTTGSNTFEDYFEYHGTISSDMMCALGNNSEDACQGDSGGGLFRLGSSFNEDVQLGIVSWGLQCGDKDFPGVYARVGEHYDWISNTVCSISDEPPSYFGCPEKALPPGDPNDPMVDITISFRLDDYRAETGWVLESIPDFRNIRFRPFGTYKSRNAVNAYNSFSETITVQSGRFYLLSVLDEFADGFCCSVGEGYFRVDYAEGNKRPIVDSTPGILWTPHALRRAFYVSPPDTQTPQLPDYVTIVVNLGIGADPGKLLLVALENMDHEALLLYEIRPFVSLNFDSSRVSSSGAVIYSRTFEVPVFGVEFNRQRYTVMVVDDNEDHLPKSSFEVYLGPIHPNNLILSQSGSYGDGNNISRSFVLFKKAADDTSPSLEANTSQLDAANGAVIFRGRSLQVSFLSLIIYVTSL
ncbi:hypothetical protein HJC23_000211 [Cyclotella cryptica]|uniref:Peptidase S1 domain-containing protein n=1 Tax=Cyclotella cryptica TaxID=29204 RepID=A0ABD3QD53_9STRA|eukprot:CCRYP_006402-RA/>CCRYP_006402-RA protein AED:0.00 eAED:0.00 QI:217/-1/1/1/-1/1/1/287/715